MIAIVSRFHGPHGGRRGRVSGQWRRGRMPIPRGPTSTMLTWPLPSRSSCGTRYRPRYFVPGGVVDVPPEVIEPDPAVGRDLVEVLEQAASGRASAGPRAALLEPAQDPARSRASARRRARGARASADCWWRSRRERDQWSARRNRTRLIRNGGMSSRSPGPAPFAARQTSADRETGLRRQRGRRGRGDHAGAGRGPWASRSWPS